MDQKSLLYQKIHHKIHCRAEITEGVGEADQVGAERDRHLSMDEIMKLLLGVDDMLEAVVDVEILYGAPNVICGVGGLPDDVEYILETVV
jgi:hypothetical protein